MPLRGFWNTHPSDCSVSPLPVCFLTARRRAVFFSPCSHTMLSHATGPWKHEPGSTFLPYEFTYPRCIVTVMGERAVWNCSLVSSLIYFNAQTCVFAPGERFLPSGMWLDSVLPTRTASISVARCIIIPHVQAQCPFLQKNLADPLNLN